jgi:hypothetical protein
MIGGDDLFLHGQPSLPDDIDFVLRWLREEWPDAMVEIPTSGSVVFVRDFSVVTTALGNEIFVYANEDAWKSWQNEGLTDDNASTLIWITVEEDGFAFVMDDRDSPSGRLVQDLMSMLQRNWWLRRSGPIFRQEAA